MELTVREAELSDVEGMVQLSEAFRSTLPGYSPVFWRKAEDSAEKQAAFFRALHTMDEWLLLVAERGGSLEGFVIARLMSAPPVYAPGGPVCLIDDFCVVDESWSSVGAPLLEAAEKRTKERGAVLSVVVCPHLGRRKRDFLLGNGFEVTSEWLVRPL